MISNLEDYQSQLNQFFWLTLAGGRGGGNVIFIRRGGGRVKYRYEMWKLAVAVAEVHLHCFVIVGYKGTVKRASTVGFRWMWIRR